MRKQDVERCPTLADMERASDGELSSPAERAAFDAHLRRCAACRQRSIALADFTDRLAGTVTTESEVLAAHTPSRARTARFVQALHSRKQAHIHQRHKTRPVFGWLSLAVIGPLVMIGLLFTRTQTAIVHAEELLTRAVSREQTRPAGSMQRVRIRLTPSYAPGLVHTSGAIGRAFDDTSSTSTPRYPAFLAVRELANGIDVEAWPASAASRGGDGASVVALLARHGFDWRTPLDLGAVRAWRAKLRDRREHVTRRGEHELLLRTSTMEGELREVQVTVRRETFHVTRQLLVFEGVGQLEIEEVAEWVSARPVLVAVATAPETVVVTPLLPDADALERAELDARLVLRDTGADLDGHLRITNAADAVHVDGPVSSAAQRRALQAQLVPLPFVRVSLAPVDVGLPDPGEAGVASARPALGRWLDRTFGEEPSDVKATFVPRLEQLVDTVSHRLAALEALAARYDAASAAALSPAARVKLQRLLDLHYRALNADLHLLDTRVAVLFGSASRTAPVAVAPADWTRRVQAAQVHALALDRQLDLLLTREDVGTGDASPDGARDEVARAFAALWEAMNAGAASAARND